MQIIDRYSQGRKLLHIPFRSTSTTDEFGIRVLVMMPTPMKSSEREATSMVEMTNVEVKTPKRKKRRKVERGSTSDADWTKYLSQRQVDLLVSVKHLAVERVRSTRDKSLYGNLTPAGLRAIGIILEEFMMDRVQTLRETPDSSSVIDALRACIENDANESKQ